MNTVEPWYNCKQENLEYNLKGKEIKEGSINFI